MIEEKQIFVNGLKIHYKTTGEGKRGAGETGLRFTLKPRGDCSLLILHGWGGSSASWVEVQRILSKRGFKVVVVDLPGFGKSVTPPLPWGISEYAKFVLNFIEKLDFKKVNLLGHSFGGRIAIKFAVLYPKRLKKLILCASAGIKHPLNFFQRIIFKLAIFGNFLFSKRPLRRFKDVARNTFYLFLRKKDYTKVKGIMKEIFKKVTKEDIKPELANIKAKTLLIWGEKDKAVPLEDAYLMRKKIPQSILEIIPGASHTPNLEMPEKITEIILKFLKLN